MMNRKTFLAVCLGAGFLLAIFQSAALAGPANDDWDNPPNDPADKPINLTQRFVVGSDIHCRMWKECEHGYEMFLGKNTAWARPTQSSQIKRAVRDVWDGRIDALTEPMSAADLRDDLLDTLNIRFLVEGIDARPHLVTYVQSTHHRKYQEYRLFITGPMIGSFEAILLVPRGAGPFPAIIGAHGHGDNAKGFRDCYYGSYYAEHGYVVLMPTFRVDDADEHEDDMSRDFLRAGFALADMRIYETLVCHKLLRALDIVKPDRIGLIGHSGGSVNGNITIRIEQRFAAYVSDLTHTSSTDPKKPYSDGTVPALYPYHELINDFSTSEVPVLQVPYGFTNGPENILAFFDHHLKD